jgi:Zn-finger protein
MAEKCAVCGRPIDIVFLEKIDGTYLRDRKGKKRPVCAACQKAHTVDGLRAKI